MSEQVCPTCGSSVSVEAVEVEEGTWRLDLVRASDQLATVTAERDQLAEMVVKVNAANELLAAQADQLQQRVENLEGDRQYLRGVRDDLQSLIIQLQQRVAELLSESSKSCDLCGAEATRVEDWGDDTSYVCDECSVPGVGEPLPQAKDGE